MSNFIEINNHGPLIVSSNYWGSDLERAGKLFVSVNAGAIRLLVPRSLSDCINEMRTAKYVILSRGAWTEEGKPDAVEFLFEDNSDSPFVIHLTPESFDLMPGEPPPNQDWILTVWIQKDGLTHKSLERPCFYRIVSKIPCMKPLDQQ